MKLYFAFGVLLLASVWADDSSSSEENLKQAIELLTKKCEQAGGKELVQKVEAAIDSAKDCLSEHIPKSPEELKNAITNEDSSSEEICDDRQKIHKCFKAAVDAVTECADEEEKYLPGFIFNAFDGVFDYVCADNGAALAKLADDQTAECINTIISNDNITDICGDKFKFLETPGDIVLTKTELCSDLDTAKTCINEFLHEHCKDAKSLIDAVEGLHHAVSGPCHKRK